MIPCSFPTARVKSPTAPVAQRIERQASNPTRCGQSSNGADTGGNARPDDPRNTGGFGTAGHSRNRVFPYSLPTVLALVLAASTAWGAPWWFSQVFPAPNGVVCEAYQRGARGHDLQRRAGMRVRDGWTGVVCTGRLGVMGVVLDLQGRVRCQVWGEAGSCPWLAAACDNGENSVSTGTCR